MAIALPLARLSSRTAASSTAGPIATLTSYSFIVMKGAITANLAGTGGLTKITEDIVTLSGANTYSGLTTVKAGELRMVGSAAWDVVLDKIGANILGGKLVFDYTNDSSPASSVLSILDASYGDGSNPFAADNGAKIYSSTAKDAHMALGWADDGVNKVTVMYTFYGDADLNGVVGSGDLSQVWSCFGSTGTWSRGDFDYNGVVGSSDVSNVLSNFGRCLRSHHWPLVAQTMSTKPRPIH